MHQNIAANKLGRDFVVGDIHGAYELLREEMRRNGFDIKTDRLFSVGDIIDRGPSSEKCIGLLDEDWFYMVRGNHEQMLIDACLNGEGYDWWNSYGTWSKWLDTELVKSWAANFSKLPISLTINEGTYSVGICHAEPDGQNWIVSRENPRSESVMLWGRRVLRGDIDYDVVGVDITIHGHTPIDDPKWVGNRYFIDTGAWETGNLIFRNIADIYSEFMAVKNVFGES